MPKIFYIDNFGPTTSNSYWLREFRRLGQVQTLDTRKLRHASPKEVVDTISQFQPTHIHFGGSCKGPEFIKPETVQQIRQRNAQARITWFYGDAYNREDFYNEVSAASDTIYVSNLSHGNGAFEHLPCPAPRENARAWKSDKKYDIVFVGNNYNTDREQQIRKLCSTHRVTIFGDKWPKDLPSQGPIGFDQYSDICQDSKIVLGDPAGPICRWSCPTRCAAGNPDGIYSGPLCRQKQCGKYQDLAGYQSNRLANTLIASTVYLIPAVDQIDQYWGGCLIAYNSISERDQQIQLILAQPNRAKEVALAGYHKVMDQHTFEHSAKRILQI